MVIIALKAKSIFRKHRPHTPVAGHAGPSAVERVMQQDSCSVGDGEHVDFLLTLRSFLPDKVHFPRRPVTHRLSPAQGGLGQCKLLITVAVQSLLLPYFPPRHAP